MEPRKSSRRPTVTLTATWGNDDAESSIRISRRRWKAIQAGGEDFESGFGWYEGERFEVSWSFGKGLVSINSYDAGTCVSDRAVERLYVQLPPEPS